ncbi:hypothetical protein [Xanthomonas campestris]|uniref:Uncharacterized protein n=1 Tax=Xanthomonas campestris pv. papavericola TaxID=487881 RepID=A0AAJ3CES8_XANCA|nr:hypothetical protein [Xanthomonas campestris]MDC8748677.1 hypothetical protein [Xanthomonas campestris]MEC3889684.1 hypothetical protein [Xanthomonas campestris pv. papavericola]
MNFTDYVSIEGTNFSSVLCYGVFPSIYIDGIDIDLNKNSSEKIQTSHKLLDSEWPYGIFLTEVKLADFNDFCGQVYKSLSAMFNVGPCIGAVCMYDGAFMDYTDIFGHEVSDQTYAFSFDSNSIVINFDLQLLSSTEWKKIIASCRKKLQMQAGLGAS